MYEQSARFCFEDELNDFLKTFMKNRQLIYRFNGNPSIKDAIEAQGVPHTEVGLILVDDLSVGFDYQLRNGDFVLVFPESNCVNVSPKVKLRDDPEIRFILDVHLGKLTRLLRMLGFDALYRNDYDDHEVARLSDKEKRIVLTRDRRLLRFKIITHGYWLRSTDPDDQINEVLERFNLHSHIKPFQRCIECNGVIESIEKELIVDQLEPKTKQYFDDFSSCTDCGKIYWKGSHYEQMRSFMEELKV